MSFDPDRIHRSLKENGVFGIANFDHLDGSRKLRPGTGGNRRMNGTERGCRMPLSKFYIDVR